VPRHVVLLRGVNLGPRNRIGMADLRAALADAGFADVKTYLQSGNVVLSSKKRPDTVARECSQLVADRFAHDVAVVVRTRGELADVVARDPLRKTSDPKRYQVTFLSKEPSAEIVDELAALAVDGEKLAHVGRELYAWHPHGVGRSKLAAALAGKRLGVTGTSRNWATVKSLLELADEE
jgi:uncharacterized protein (DUF1697 family)